MKTLTLTLLILGLAAAHAQTRTGVCMLSPSEKHPEQVSFLINRTDCDGDGGCGTSNSSWRSPKPARCEAPRRSCT